MSESYYHLAKFYALNNEPDNAISNLRKAIIDFDRNYSLKASGDPDFNKIRDSINNLIENLKKSSRIKLMETINGIGRDFNPKDENVKEKLNKLWNKIEKYISENTYFFYVDCLPIAKQLLVLYNSAINQKDEYKKNYERAINELRELEAFLENNMCTDRMTDLRARLRFKEAKILLQNGNNKSYIEFIEFSKNFRKHLYEGWITKKEY